VRSEVGRIKNITTEPIIPNIMTAILIQNKEIKNEQERVIMVHIIISEMIFDFSGSPFPSRKSRMYCPRYLLVISLLYNFSELRMYKAAVKSKNGVVGRPGIMIPIKPKNSEIVPSIIHNILINVIENMLN
jgi:hypothetical protein